MSVDAVARYTITSILTIYFDTFLHSKKKLIVNFENNEYTTENGNP